MGRQRSNAIRLDKSPLLGTIRIKFGGFGTSAMSFTPVEQEQLIEATLDAIDCSTLAIEAARTGFASHRDLVQTWFGTGNAGNAVGGVMKMHAILTDHQRTITFVDARGRSEKLIGKTGSESCAGGRETRDVYGVTRVVPMTSGDYAYVKTCRSGGCEATAAHIGSGMKVYIGERGFHHSKSLKDRTNTVYHELTHKVLGAIDHAYGVGPCKTLATTDPARAIKCSDNWSYFVTCFKYAW